MEKKMTYAVALSNAIEVVADEETRARLEDLKASLEKKATKKSKVDNSGYFDSVREALADGEKTPTELVGVIGVANTQKVSSILKAMGDEVERVINGKKVTYKLA